MSKSEHGKLNTASKKRFNLIRLLRLLGLFILLLVVFSSKWYQANFAGNTLDAVLFTLKAPVQGTTSGVLFAFVREAILPSALLTITLRVISILVPKVTMNISQLRVRVYPQSLLILILILTLIQYPITTISELKVIDYVRAKRELTTLFDDYYVTPSETIIRFPQAKRNLVYIVLESMESTYFSREFGGISQQNLIPSLTSIAVNNTSFSKDVNLMGAQVITGTEWTTGALVAQTSGTPLILPIDGNAYSGYGQFMPGLVTLGDILKKQGYNQVFMIGSDANFGGRKDYFESHGDYKILDYSYAVDSELIPEEYWVWWGYEDAKLYEFAKEELLNLSLREEPFNFTMLTVDTHHISGYVCKLCSTEYESQYSNVIACADKQIAQFVEWLQAQPFYDNTTIVIVGDHLSMDPEYFSNIPDTYERTIYNTFINPQAHAIKEKNRSFTVLDMFPTTLAALGVEIEGDRLGLGTNLFSTQNTLIEELGLEYVSHELRKNSELYNRFLFSD